MNRYHPVVDFFQSNLPVDVNVNEELEKLYEILGVTVGLEKTLIAKWLVQCVAMVFNTNTTPWTCHLMKNNEEIFKGNPTSVIINLKYRLNKGI